jgi:cytosine/adenosine deaminase-related metal-dependent hydrolase
MIGVADQTVEPADAEKSEEDLAYWRARENEERDRAAAASCMARTAHEDLADDYADLIARHGKDGDAR